MTEIILVRHGETVWNMEEVFRGKVDVALSDVGEQQAGLLAEYLCRDIPPEVVYCSPLKRAVQTAEAIFRCSGVEVLVEPGLSDLDFGDWQGLTVGEVRRKYPALYQEWQSHPERVMMPGGEGLGDVWKRSLDVISRVLHRHYERIVLVAHRVVNKILICAMLGMDSSCFWKVRQDTCGITVFSYDGGRFIMMRHNERPFLEPLRAIPRSDF